MNEEYIVIDNGTESILRVNQLGENYEEVEVIYRQWVNQDNVTKKRIHLLRNKKNGKETRFNSDTMRTDKRSEEFAEMQRRQRELLDVGEYADDVSTNETNEEVTSG